MSPLKIGFIASLILHSLLIAMFVTIDKPSQISKKSNNVSINLSNIQNVNPTQNHPIAQHKKERKSKQQPRKPKEVVKKEIKPQQNTPKIIEEKPQVVEEIIEESLVESNETSDVSNDFNDTQNANMGGGGVQTLDKNSELFIMIKSIIDKNNQYPRMARKRGIEGSVVVEFVLFKNGDISDIKILTKAHKSLNQSAVNAIKRSYKDFPSMDNNVRISITISYELT